MRNLTATGQGWMHPENYSHDGSIPGIVHCVCAWQTASRAYQEGAQTEFLHPWAPALLWAAPAGTGSSRAVPRGSVCAGSGVPAAGSAQGRMIPCVRVGEYGWQVARRSHWSMDLAAGCLCEQDQWVGVTLHTPASKQHLLGDGFAQVSPPAALLMQEALYKTQDIRGSPLWPSRTHFARSALRSLLVSRHEGAVRGLCCVPAFLLGHPR